MTLLEMKKDLPYVYEAVAKMFQIIWIPQEEYDNVDIKKEWWFSKYERTDKQEEEFKDWLYRKLMDNTSWRKEIMQFPIKKKDMVDKTVAMFIFNYGLKTKQDDK